MISVTNVSLDPFKKSSCVLQSELSTHSKQKVQWVSRNAYDMLKITQLDLSHLDILAFIPRVLAKKHPVMFDNFFKRGYSNYINRLHTQINIDMNNVLFPSNIFVKMFFENDELSLLSYIEELDECNMVLLDDWGNIDSFTNRFSNSIGLSCSFPHDNKSCSIFVLLPQLIPLFLPLYFDLPTFKVEVI